jgi:hypothetical protein
MSGCSTAVYDRSIPWIGTAGKTEEIDSTIGIADRRACGGLSLGSEPIESVDAAATGQKRQPLTTVIGTLRPEVEPQAEAAKAFQQAREDVAKT